MSTEPSDFPVYKGSCHCGFISYSCNLSLKTASPVNGAILTRCNCSICVKSGVVLCVPTPQSSFKLRTPTEGEAAIPVYTFNSHAIKRHFCPKCGICVWLSGTLGGSVFARVNALTLDGREDDGKLEELKDIKVRYFDGRTRLGSALANEPYDGGLW